MLAIAGGKGGTGKTTTALALARAFATGRRRSMDDEYALEEVIVVDADVDMPDLHSMAGVPREPTVEDRDRGRQVPEMPGVRVAPAPRAGTTQLECGGVDDETVVGDALRALRRDRDELVLVDTPCGAGPDATRPLAIADAVVLVTLPTPSAVRDTVKTAAMANALTTPIVGCAVVDATPTPPLADVFGLDHVVPIPGVDGDPLRSDEVRTAAAQLAMNCTAGQTPF